MEFKPQIMSKAFWWLLGITAALVGSVSIGTLLWVREIRAEDMRRVDDRLLRIETAIDALKDVQSQRTSKLHAMETDMSWIRNAIGKLEGKVDVLIEEVRKR